MASSCPRLRTEQSPGQRAARRRSVADAGGPTPCASHRTTSSGSGRIPRSSAPSERPGVDYLRETNPGPCVRPCISYHGGGGCHVATSDPIAEIIGDYRAFAAMQRDRLVARGIDIAPYPLSHLAVRVADWDLYVHQRTLLERRSEEHTSELQSLTNLVCRLLL